MSMQTNLHGRLRNTSLPRSHGLLPLFEAVINSIHSIEDAGLGFDQGQIAVEINRTPQSDFDFKNVDEVKGRSQIPDIASFKVTDNGIGFSDANMESFETLDSDYKVKRGGRGIGRLLWLKAFTSVSVKSLYKDKLDTLRSREFTFNSKMGVSKPIVKSLTTNEKPKTEVLLAGFLAQYRDASSKTALAIANSLFEHCLWYFVRPGGAPNICIRDGAETILLDDVYNQHMHTSATNESFKIKNKTFDLTHVKLRTGTGRSHVIAFCASNRLVKDENISGKIPGLHSKIKDKDGEFVYACYVSSSFLDDNVRSERTDFNISEDSGELYSGSEISFKEIRDAVIDKATNHLGDYLKENIRMGVARVDEFISHKAPRYRPIMARIPEGTLNVDPNISDKDLDLMLHKVLSDVEGKLLFDGHNVMSPKEHEQPHEYQERLKEYLQTAEDLKKSDLVNYVFHRRIILDVLEKAIGKDENGKYSCEDLIHNLIMPMGKDSNDAEFDGFNLWLLDERLAFHDYLASDKTFSSMPITVSAETKQPDICALNIYDNPVLVSEGSRLPLASIVIVEIKRPMRNDAQAGEEKDPIEQALNYLDKVRKGTVQTAKGRPIPNSEDIPGFCYAICDITPSIKKRCEVHGLTVTSDKLGYFGYNHNYKAYIEVISFDRLVNAAKERNRAFFDRLGLPTT